MTVTQAPQPTVAAPNARALDAHDRCDRCGAQAYVEVASKTTPSTMLFCAHHAREHKDALIAQGFVVVVDETSRLTETNRQQGADHA